MVLLSVKKGNFNSDYKKPNTHLALVLLRVLSGKVIILKMRIPGGPVVKDSTLLLQEAWVPSLVGELRPKLNEK